MTEIQAAAESFRAAVGRNHGVALAYGREAVVWVHDHVEGLRTRTDLTALRSLAASVAAFPGECLLRSGAWREIEGEWAVHFDEGCTAFPFTAVRQQFAGAKGASILAYYDAVSEAFAPGELE